MVFSLSSTTALSKTYYVAVLQALLVTILWSSSWVIIKFGLRELSPLVFAGLRYSIASLILLGMIFSKMEYRNSIKGKSSEWWIIIGVYGVIFVAITQGSLFVGLEFLPAITVSLLLSLTPIVVLVLSVSLLKEVPSVVQSFFILLAVFGAIIYFYPIDLASSELFGFFVVCTGVLANAFSVIMGRKINKPGNVPPIVVTGFSMALGAFLLLVFGILIEGLPSLSLVSLLLVLWLSVVNTAFAFTLWNRSMQKLRAIDNSLINNTMLPQIVILSIIFLGELPGLLEWVGLILIGLSVLVVQISQAVKGNTL